KGRSNYICMNKFYKAFIQPDLFDIDGYKTQIDNISDWLKVTDDGSKSGLNFIPDNKLWESICAEADNCLKNKCKFFNDCFVNKIRREANAAHILIVNHHILLSDIVYKFSQNNYKINGVLPAYKRIIFDEAHNLEDAATKHLGIDISRNGIIKTLNYLYNTFQGKERGVLQYVKNSIIFKSKIRKKEKILSIFGERIMPAINSLKNEIDISFDIIKNYFLKKYSKRDVFQGFKLRITGEIAAEPEFFENCESVIIDMIKQFIELSKSLDLLLKTFKNECETAASETDEIIRNDVGFAKIKIDSIYRALSDFINPQDIDNTVRWTECSNAQKKEIKLFAAPIDISKLFFNSVALPHKTVVFTSATLTVNKKFDFLKKIFGMEILSEDSILECILDTPFDYKNQAILTIPSDLPFPDDFNFTAETNSFLKKMLIMNERSAFLLFTSYSQLKKTADYLRNELEAFDFNIFVQGEKPRGLLLESFKKYRKSILFATDSFWEGVDVQGEALELVALFKLPFKTPDDPVLEAKNELLVKNGKNPFFEYQLPKAVIKLKQGVGRLIRTKNDYGAITILDKRIKVKSYGQTFISSLPDMKIIYGPSEKCLSEISNFFN
ncbi:MAG TPA: helicase C-terminal domain-containing protein, partial [bacterium]|nr:helicase C-terminal domain-containing protein [bacterium]